MNVNIALTLDGLVRALRWKAHELADEVELHRPESRDADRAKEERNDRSQR